MKIINYTNLWDNCFFFGGEQKTNQSKLNENILQQDIDVKNLSVLINSHQAKYNVNGYLGGFADEQSSTLFKISFINAINRTLDIATSQLNLLLHL